MKGSISIITLAMMKVGAWIYFLVGKPRANAGPKWKGVNGKYIPLIYAMFNTAFNY